MITEGYDIIGDIHGHADELIKLLSHLGYEASDTGYKHPNRKVVFLGDFIDGPEHLSQHKELLNIVMTMVRNGHAHAVMGNHEFNALAYHTKHDGEYLRPRIDKNTKQHQAFLNEYDDDEESKQEVLKFFYELPMWLELDGLRAIHACWDQKRIDHLKEMAPDGILTPSLLIEASQKDSAAYEALEVLLKGFEVDLPGGIKFLDKNGHERTAVRVAWWDNWSSTLGAVHLPRDIDIGLAAEKAIPDTVPRYKPNSRPCFVGHYWLSGKPAPLAHNVACLDYSVAKEGKLVAYRWSGEQRLSDENFTHVGL